MQTPSQVILKSRRHRIRKFASSAACLTAQRSLMLRVPLLVCVHKCTCAHVTTCKSTCRCTHESAGQFFPSWRQAEEGRLVCVLLLFVFGVGLAVVDVVVAVLAHVHVSVSVCTCCPTFLVAVLASARSQRAIQD